MIGTIDIKINAAHPNLPLEPLLAFQASPSSVRLIGVPKAIGKWSLTAVKITYTLPSNLTSTVSCVQTGSCWVGSIPACATVGVVKLGLAVVADGTDETGAAVTGYVLGRGDIRIISSDATVTVGTTKFALRYCETQPSSPTTGDCCVISGTFKWYNGTAWVALGGSGGGDVYHAEFSSIDPETVTIYELATILKGSN